MNNGARDAGWLAKALAGMPVNDMHRQFVATAAHWRDKARDAYASLFAAADRGEANGDGETGRAAALPERARPVYPGVDRLRRVVENFKLCVEDWQYYQMQLFSSLLCTLLPLILGDDMDTCGDDVMRKYGWQSLHEEAFCIMPRGCGKSTCIGAALACVMVEVPRFSGIFYSMDADKASSLMTNNFVTALNTLRCKGRVRGELKIGKSEVKMRGRSGENDERSMISLSARGGVSDFSLFFFSALFHMKKERADSQWYHH